MNIFSKLKISKSKSESNLTQKVRESKTRKKPGSRLSYRIVSTTSSTSSENDKLTEIIEPNEIEFLKASMDYTLSEEETEEGENQEKKEHQEEYDQGQEEEKEGENGDETTDEKAVENVNELGIESFDDSFAQIGDLNKLSKKQLRSKLEDIYSEKHELIKEFTRIIEIKDGELTKLRNDILSIQQKFKIQEKLLHQKTSKLEQALIKSEKFADYLNQIVSNDAEVISIAENEIFEVGKYLCELLGQDKEDFESKMIKSQELLQNYLQNNLHEKLKQPPVNCQNMVPLLEKVGQKFIQYESEIKNQNNIVKEIVGLTENLIQGLKFILDNKTSRCLENIFPKILNSELNLQQSEVLEYCQLINQVIYEIQEYANGHKQMVRMINKGKKKKVQISTTDLDMNQQFK